MTFFELAIVIIFVFAFFIQMVYYWGIFSGFAFYKDSPKIPSDYPPVSVVISARNEYHNLQKNLPLILTQNYPEFEVVIVNHASNDETGLYLKELQQTHSNLKVVQIDRELNFFTGKKFPLSLGIKSAKNEILLLTDADCQPVGNDWIKFMVSNYDEKTEVVLGYGPYKEEKGFVNKLVRYDTFMVALQYLSFAVRGIPYMGVGRNLSYLRSTFFKNKGFTSHYKIPSGDDDLFIRQVANKHNTRIEINQGSFMYSEAEKSFGKWLKQKRRHLTTGKHYKFNIKLLLSLFSITQFLFYASTIALLVLQVFPFIVLGIFLIRLVSVAFIQKNALKRCEERNLFLFSLLWEVFHVLAIQTITLTSIFIKPKKWK
jgi:glycosyltransferase involved in cell wall biosynthesis